MDEDVNGGRGGGKGVPTAFRNDWRGLINGLNDSDDSKDLFDELLLSNELKFSTVAQAKSLSDC